MSDIIILFILLLLNITVMTVGILWQRYYRNEMQRIYQKIIGEYNASYERVVQEGNFKEHS